MFAPDDLTYFDFENFSARVDLKDVGTYAYSTTANARSCSAYAVGGAPAHTWHDDGAILDWDHAPHVFAPPTIAVRPSPRGTRALTRRCAIYMTLGFPFLAPERVIDPMI